MRSAAGRKSPAVAVTPMKPLAESKTRLAPALPPARRAALSVAMLRSVLDALRRSRMARIIVVGGDDLVRGEARGMGAEWRPDEFGDLNAALAAAFRALRSEGAPAAYVPADLPLLAAEDVDALLDASEDGAALTFCPAHDGGTNAIVAPPSAEFEPLLGTDSFRRHKAAARRRGQSARIARLPGFERDLDTIEDLRICLRARPPSLAAFADLETAIKTETTADMETAE